MPYTDVPYNDPAWESIQRIGLTGILRGTGKPQGWANKTFFYPDSSVNGDEFQRNFNSFDSFPFPKLRVSNLTISEACTFSGTYLTYKDQRNNPWVRNTAEIWSGAGLSGFDPSRIITRKELAVLLDRYVHVFERRKVNLNGAWRKY